MSYSKVGWTYLCKEFELASIHTILVYNTLARHLETLCCSRGEGKRASWFDYDQVILKATVDIIAISAATNTTKSRCHAAVNSWGEVTIETWTGGRRPGITKVADQAHRPCGMVVAEQLCWYCNTVATCNLTLDLTCSSADKTWTNKYGLTITTSQSNEVSLRVEVVLF